MTVTVDALIAEAGLVGLGERERELIAEAARKLTTATGLPLARFLIVRFGEDGLLLLTREDWRGMMPPLTDGWEDAPVADGDAKR